MFGKRLSHYLGFQKLVLGLLAAVGLARLGLSLAIGIVVPPLLLWGVASLVLSITKRVARRPAAA